MNLHISLIFLIFLVFSGKIFSLDIVIYENPPMLHDKETINAIEEKKKNLIEIKKYNESCNIECMLSESLYQSYLYYTEIKNRMFYLDIYETKTGNKIYSFKEELTAESFRNIILKGNALISLYDYNVIDVFQAIDEENLKLFKYFIKNKRNLTKLNSLGMSALNYALYKKRYNLIKYLIKERSVIYTPDIDGIVPLHRIAEWGDIVLFKKFYFKFLNNIVSNNGNNFLHYAILSGNIKLVSFLLNNGFTLKDKNKLNKNSLHFAAESGNKELFDFIYEKNSDLLLQITKNKENILHFASKSGNIELYKYIITLLKEQKFDIEKLQFDKYHRNYIFYSVIANKENYISEFIKLGQKFELDKFNNSALHYAVLNGKMTSVRDLISLGLDIKQEDKYKRTPVLLGFRYLVLKDLKEMLTDMTFTNLRDENGLTALHYAVLGNKFKTINYLFSHNIDINTKSRYGENSLFFAILNKSEALFLYLYYRGVSSDILLDSGDTLLHMAAQEKNPWFFNFLLNHNKKIYTMNKRKEYPLDVAVKTENLSVVKSINLKRQQELYRPDLNNNRILERVIMWGTRNVFDYLIKENIRVDIPNNKHECALDIAVKFKRNYMISQLNKIGAPMCNN